MVEVSIIIPVRNAEETLQQCLDSIFDLDFEKEKFEVILVDGMSTDNTRNIAQLYNVSIIENPYKYVVAARNLGLKIAKGKFIAFTDADCTMPKDWLANALKYFADGKVAGVGGANLIPDNEKPFAKAIGLIFNTAHSFNAGAPTQVYNKVIESRFHGANAIYRAEALRKVMPIDERIYAAEDVVMNTKLTDLGYKLLYVPDVVVNHYRRTTPKSWWNQMHHYGVGKALLKRYMPKGVTKMQLAMAYALPVLIIILILLFLWSFQFGIILLGLCFLMAINYAYFKDYSLDIAINMPLALSILFVAWSLGFFRETFFPKKRNNM